MPDLTRRDAVELARVGNWALSSGNWRAAPEDFASAIAATACPAVRRPYVRVGHTDERFGDGEPAVGWIENLRLSDGGRTLVGDLVGVPSWLNDVMASAYPDRSIEAAYGRRCALNHTHPFVLDGLALLGVTRPGVGTLKPIGGLDDVQALFDAEPVAASSGEVRIAASIPGEAMADADVDDAELAEVFAAEGHSENNLKTYFTKDPRGLKRWATKPHPWRALFKILRRHLDEERAKRITSQWYLEVFGHTPNQKTKVKASEVAVPNPQPSYADIVREAWNATGPPFSQHVHAVRAGTAIVLDEADRSFWRVPVTVDGDAVSFGQRERVMPDFVDYDEDRIAASTTFATREESRPEVASVLDTPPTPLDPSPPAEPAPPSGPPAEVDPEPLTPPDEGGVSVSDEDPQESGAEPVDPSDPEKEAGHVSSTLSTDVRSRLGLTDEVDDAAVLSALDALKSKADSPPEPSPEQVAASAAAEQEKSELRKEVQVLASQVEQMSTKLATAEAERAATVKASVLDEAQRLGKFKPADRQQWEEDYDSAPAAITRTLARIAAGTEVPVVAAGYTGTGDEGNVDDEYEKLVAGIDGPYAKKEA